MVEKAELYVSARLHYFSNMEIKINFKRSISHRLNFKLQHYKIGIFP